MDKEKDLQEKLANFDELELLVEGIDNANGLLEIFLKRH